MERFWPHEFHHRRDIYPPITCSLHLDTLRFVDAVSVVQQMLQSYFRQIMPIANIDDVRKRLQYLECKKMF